MDPKLKKLLDQVGGEELPPEFEGEVPESETIVEIQAKETALINIEKHDE